MQSLFIPAICSTPWAKRMNRIRNSNSIFVLTIHDEYSFDFFLFQKHIFPAISHVSDVFINSYPNYSSLCFIIMLNKEKNIKHLIYTTTETLETASSAFSQRFTWVNPMPKAYFARAFRREKESSKPISNSWKGKHNSHNYRSTI